MGKTFTYLRREFSRFFSVQSDTALALGLIIGFMAACAAAIPRDRLIQWDYWMILLVLAPGIANRSLWRLIVAPLSLIPAGMAVWVMIIDGRESLPLPVWAGAAVMVPGDDNSGMPWQGKALIGFGLFWLSVDLVQVLLHRFEGVAHAWPKPGIRSRVINGALTILVTVLLTLVLYIFSWSAFVSGTLVRPLYTPAEFYSSLILYGGCFAFNLFLVHWLYEYLLRKMDWWL